MRKLIEYFAKQATLVNVITIFVFIFGFYSLFKIKREAFPNIDFDIVQVLTVYPGASPETVERIITNPLEQDILEVDGIKKMYSVSTEATSLIFLTLDPDVLDSEKGKQDIKEVIDGWTGLLIQQKNRSLQKLKQNEVLSSHFHWLVMLRSPCYAIQPRL